MRIPREPRARGAALASALAGRALPWGVACIRRSNPRDSSADRAWSECGARQTQSPSYISGSARPASCRRYGRDHTVAGAPGPIGLWSKAPAAQWCGHDRHFLVVPDTDGERAALMPALMQGSVRAISAARIFARSAADAPSVGDMGPTTYRQETASTRGSWPTSSARPAAPPAPTPPSAEIVDERPGTRGRLRVGRASAAKLLESGTRAEFDPTRTWVADSLGAPGGRIRRRPRERRAVSRPATP